jgi:phospholipase/carboxylesterase
VPVEGPAREFGEPVLRLKDPDGIIVKLVGADLPAAAPLPDPDAPTRLRAVTLLSAEPEASAAFLARFGYRAGPVEGGVRRMVSAPTRSICATRRATCRRSPAPG